MNAVEPQAVQLKQNPFAAIRREIQQANHLPGSIYTSEEVAQQEKEQIFMRQWLCVAREEEVAKPGDYVSLRIAGEPVVVSRGKDGKVQAFMNMCLHRGVEIAQGSGNTEMFRCPYHAWTYGIDGKLIGAPRMKEAGRDMSGCRLPTVRSATWRGWVWINFDVTAPAFEDFIAPLAQATPWYRTGECRIARKLTFDVACNWKFIAENLLDWYHASVIHAGTFGKYYKLGPEALPAKLLPEGASVIEFDNKSRSLDPNLPFPTMPWLADKSVFSAKGAIFPNINFWSGMDSLRMWHLWPVSPGQTHAVCYILLPEAAFGVEDFEAKLDKYSDYVRKVAQEDRELLESLQRGVASPRFTPGPLSHLELQLQHLLKHYITVMGFADPVPVDHAA